MKRKHRGYGDTFFIDEVFAGVPDQKISRVSEKVYAPNQLVELQGVGGLHHRYEWREAAGSSYDLLFAKDTGMNEHDARVELRRL